MDDLEIIMLYLNRDEAAIQETDKKYGGLCHRIAMNILSVKEDAEECVSDTYQKAWYSIPPERPNAFRIWLGKIVRNFSINRWHYNRAVKRYSGAEELLSELSDCIPDCQTTDRILEAKELSLYISNWLNLLADEDMVLFVRRYWYGEQLQDIAVEYSISPNKLAGKMYRLRKKLQQYNVRFFSLL